MNAAIDQSEIDLRPVHRRNQPVVHGHDDVALPGAAPEGRAVLAHALDDQVEAPLLAVTTKCESILADND